MGVLAHDLRGPLSAISSSADSILHGKHPSADELKKTAEWIRNSSVRMERIVNDLVDFTRTRLGGVLPLTRKQTDLAEACRHVVQEIGARHADRDIEVDCSGELTGNWDPVRLEQLVSNLLSNARQYGRADAPVTFRAKARGDDVVLSVHNEGEPIPRETRRSMFDPLVRHAADEDSGRDHLGLGLYVVKMIVNAHQAAAPAAAP